METQFRNLELAILSQPMPPEFRDTKATVLCNDCSGRSVVAYHWLGLKCSICQSYNTVELQIHGQGSQELETATERADAIATPQLEQSTGSTRAVPIAAAAPGPRAGTLIPSRRRHSSHGVELQHRAPERVARSLSPLVSGAGSHMPHAPADADSDDDIFGFWRGNRVEEDEDDGSDGDEYDSDEDSEEAPEDDDDEDDEDDEILLIGHR